MTERFGLRAVRMIGVAVVSLLLIVGGAFAADQLANSGARDELAAPTATRRTRSGPGFRDQRRLGLTRGQRRRRQRRLREPGCERRHGDDDSTASPGATFDDDGDSDDDSTASPGATFDDDGDDQDDDSTASPGATFDDHGGTGRRQLARSRRTTTAARAEPDPSGPTQDVTNGSPWQPSEPVTMGPTPSGRTPEGSEPWRRPIDPTDGRTGRRPAER